LIIDEPQDDFGLLCFAAAERVVDARRISDRQDSAVATSSPPETETAGRPADESAGRP
jgi:hypothetical protein